MRVRHLLLLLGCAAGCTSIDHVDVRTPGPPSAGIPNEPFVTPAPISVSYESLGLVQVEKSGVWLFGNIPIPDTDLTAGYDLLREVARERGADGVINVRFHTQQYSTFTRVLFAMPLFFIPLSGNVTYSGELVRLKSM